MKVKDLMVTNVATCRPEDSLNEAARIFWEHDCGCAPVVDGDTQLAGMITDRDICMAAYTKGRALQDLKVSEAMSTEVWACRPGDAAGTAEGLMREKLIRRLPVVGEDGRLVGILSLNDLARAAARQRDSRTKQITDEEVAQTLSAVCEGHASRQSAAGG